MAHYHLKAWPNGLGYDFGRWELVKQGDIWYATFKPHSVATKHGQGATWKEAVFNAKPIKEGI